MAKTIPTVTVDRHVKATLNGSMGNAIMHSGADSNLLGSAFRMLKYTDRLSPVISKNAQLFAGSYLHFTHNNYYFERWRRV